MRSIANFFFSALCPLFHGIASVCVVGERGGVGGGWKGGRSKEKSKWLIRINCKMDLPLPIFQPISKTFQKDRLTPKISF